MTRQEALDKARKLFDHAADPATNQEEHDTFTAKALAIMREHGIRMDEIGAAPPQGNESEKFTAGEIIVGGLATGALFFLDRLAAHLAQQRPPTIRSDPRPIFYETNFQRPAGGRRGER